MISHMNEVYENGPRNSFAEKDWVQKLYESYSDQGYKVYSVVRRPPLRPMQRIVEAGQRYDYYSVPLPLSDDAETITTEYNELMRQLREDPSISDVVTTFPTDTMLQADPTIGRETHVVVMTTPPVSQAAAA